MPKPKDNSTNKFLQRIAGKKALAPPPTPRPVIGEHPVRTLMRENRDDETLSQTVPVKAEQSRLEERNDSLLQTAKLPLSNNPPPPQNNITAQSEAVKNIVVPGVNTTSIGVRPSEDYNVPALNDIEAQVAFEKGKGNELRPSSGDGSGKASIVKKKPDSEETRQDQQQHHQNIAALATGSGGAAAVAEEEAYLVSIKQKYRLNSGEYALYKELYMMTHAVGRTECSFVVSEIMKSTGMLERRVRDNLRRLKKNGWIVLLEGYDFENREKPKYRVNTQPEF